LHSNTKETFKTAALLQINESATLSEQLVKD